MEHTITMTIPNDPLYLKWMRDSYSTFVHLFTSNKTIIRDGKICLCELASNIIKHSENTTSYILKYMYTVSKISVKLQYNDRFFSPDSVKKPDITSLPSGGYGVHIVKKISDDVTYEHDNGKTTVTFSYDLKK